jgi:hypothetical protein
MSSEILARAAELAKQGSPQKGIGLLQPVIRESPLNAAAIVAMAYCHEQEGAVPAAIYLYSKAIRLNPQVAQWAARLANCNKIHNDRIDQVKSRKPGGWLLWLALLLFLLAGLSAALAFPGIVAECADYLAGFDPSQYPLPFLGLCAGLALLGAVSGSVWTAKRLRYGAELRRAIGEDFADKRHAPCWHCDLNYLRGLKQCPYCLSPRRPPKPPEPVPAAAPKTPSFAAQDSVAPVSSGGNSSEAFLSKVQGAGAGMGKWLRSISAKAKSREPVQQGPVDTAPVPKVSAIAGTGQAPAKAMPSAPGTKSTAVMVLAIIGLVLGSLGLLISLLPCVGWLGVLGTGPAFILSLVALIIALVKQARKGLAIAAVVVSVLGIAVPVVELLLLAGFVGGSGLGSAMGSTDRAEKALEKKRKKVKDAATAKYPPAKYPMGMSPNDFRNANWILSPDKTAAARKDGSEVREFKTGKTLRLFAEGQFRSWSPDSQWIAYENKGVCCVRRDGTVNLRLANDLGFKNDRLPTWQPGSHATLLFFDGQRYHQCSLDAGRDRVIATGKELRFAYTTRLWFSPNGSWIYYCFEMGLGNWPIGYMRANGEDHRSSNIPYGADFTVRWSQDCDTMSSVFDDTMFFLHLPTGRVTPICGARRIGKDYGTYVRNYVLSPDGRQVAFFESGRNLILLNAQDGSMKQFDNSQFKPSRLFCFSPDARFLTLDAYTAKNIEFSDREDRDPFSFGADAFRVSQGVLDLQKNKLTLFKMKDLQKELTGLKESGLSAQDLGWNMPFFNKIWWNPNGKTLQGSTDDLLTFEFSPDGGRFERVWPDRRKVPFMTAEQFDIPSAPLEKDPPGEFKREIVAVPSVAQDLPFQPTQLPVQVMEIKEQK